jgi:hypothetical protein
MLKAAASPANRPRDITHFGEVASAGAVLRRCVRTGCVSPWRFTFFSYGIDFRPGIITPQFAAAFHEALPVP